ncbi:MAG: YbgC/FadM family acyl-CoA thioesterase [Campylobacterota bacterium]|nr:YbgC/FadM family acyl-CoA thioesterase [Campylobacterota bacterium]
MKIRVYYEDTDAGGIVYHTNYIKYCERARSEIFFEQGMMPGEDLHSGFIVKDLKAGFLATASLGDLLDVRTSLLKLRSSSTLLQQEVYREDTKLFSMEILLVYVRNGKPVRIPEHYKKLFDLLSTNTK